MKKNIVDFNHISKEIPKQDVDALMEYYKYYHRKLWCVKKCYKYYTKILRVISYLPLIMTSSGIISSGASLNPLLLIISGVGVSLAAACKKVEPRLETKKNACKTASITYKKLLDQIRSYLRGIKYDMDDLIREFRIIDSMLTDILPMRVSKYEKDYDKKVDG